MSPHFLELTEDTHEKQATAANPSTSDVNTTLQRSRHSYILSNVPARILLIVAYHSIA